ncbi:hypothetical protein GobsT_13570 [Gemmata obscuriglobus]|uniref:PEP-CTERM sorting domain-containing protein n=1 Tax=Gemmata obscuriglobus TaxID=114 RepID=A0A2Z3H0A2_9BACT|nr:hypothetical protein [Gemmata obscuriglobus]AWM40199.1 hypothetical protein C1280_26470 [Gemmata obscuriglobus]QEG26614.1 hypothetical protein GobsT_13570 [Gemmata obscuriglobus]VTS02131.1 unnamed protein product [Gemmata obscuriglobus UQM 2246]
MFLRQFRRTIASLAVVAAIAASPAESKAGVQILVEEINNGSVVGSQYATLSGSGITTFNGTAFTNVLVTVSSNSAAGSPIASLTPSFSGQLTDKFNVALDQLRITVTDDGFTPNGNLGTLRVETSGSTGFASGTEAVSSTTRLYNPNAGSQVPASSMTQLANGQTIAGPINLTTPNGIKVTGESEVNGLVSPFAIQQTLTVSFSGDIPAGATFGATGGASVTAAAAVPAPGGLVLACFALPLIGLRRAFRKPAE